MLTQTFDFAVDFDFSVGVTVRVFGAGGPAASVPWTFENIQTAAIHAANTICPVLYFFVNIIPFCSILTLLFTYLNSLECVAVNSNILTSQAAYPA